MKLGLILGSDPLKHGAVLLDKHVTDDAPAVPAELHCPEGQTYPWGMLGNDLWGDCVEAAMEHGDLCFYLRRGMNPWPYADKSALDLYSAIAGFDPNAGPSGSNPTDNGTDPSQAMRWWADNGLWPIPGHRGRHALVGFGSLPASSPNLRRAIWEFGCVILAVALPTGAQSQGVNWRGSNLGAPGSWGGHGIAGNGFTADLIEFVSWGQLGDMDNAFAGAYLEQTFVPLSRELLDKTGVSPTGFNYDTLKADLPSPEDMH